MVMAWQTVMHLLTLANTPPVNMWNYENPRAWARLYPLCAGPLQSPINVVPPPGLPVTENMTVTFAPGMRAGEIRGVNTGRDIRLQFRPKNISAPLVTIGFARNPQFGEFRLHEVILHWAEGQNEHGSEHEINGRVFDAEAQMVFINSNYSTYEEAIKHPGGIAILAAMMNSNSNGNFKPPFPLFGLDKILEGLASIGSTIHLPTDLRPLQGFFSRALAKFYMYHGSLTQPPCNPVVLWMISATEFSMEWEFLHQLYAEIFQDRTHSIKIYDNRRPVQPAGSRKITTYINPA